MKKTLTLILAFTLILSSFAGMLSASATEGDQPKYIDVSVPAVWIPIDPTTGEVYDYLTPLVTHPNGYAGGLSEVAEWQDIEDGGNYSFTLPKYNGSYVISYMGTRADESTYQVNNFMYTSNVFFSDRFHKVVAQGYGTYEEGENSPVRKVVYGEFEDTQNFNENPGLHGMQKTAYQEGETLELYIATITEDAFLSEADFVQPELTVRLPGSTNALINLLERNINSYTYLSMEAAEEYKIEYITIENKDINLETVFLYKYNSGDRSQGEYLKNAGGEYLNIVDELSIEDLAFGEYELVIPIYWQRMIPNSLSAPDVFSRTRYKIDDSIHFTLIVEPNEDLQIGNYEGVYDGLEHAITVDGILDGDDGDTVYYSTDGESWTETNPKFTDAGEYTVYVKTENDIYPERTGTGSVKIAARPISITAAGDSKIYDGTPLTNSDWSLSEGTLAENEIIESVTVSGSRTDVGSSPNVPSNAYIYKQAEQEPVLTSGDSNVEEQELTHNYDISYINGVLTVERRGGGPIVDPEGEVPEDLNPDHIAYIQGYPGNVVRPEANVTREEVAAVFFRLLKPNYRDSIRSTASVFTDVGTERWSTKHIGTLANGDILEGYPDGSFRPETPITRAELATIASRFDDLEPAIGELFTDTSGHWAEKYINSAQAKGWIEGYPDGSFKPDQYITRAELVTLVNNVLQRRVHKADILPDVKQFSDLDEDKWYYEALQEAINSHLYTRMSDGYEKWTEIHFPTIEM